MALIIEDGTGRSDAESVSSVTEVDAYHTKWGNSGWTGTEAEKEAAIRKGNRYMTGQYEHRLTGTRKKDEQKMPYPRSSSFYADGRWITDSTIPSEWKEGVAEASLRARLASLPSDQEAGGAWLSEFSLEELSVTYEEGKPGGAVYPEIDDAVRPLLRSSIAVMRM